MRVEAQGAEVAAVHVNTWDEEENEGEQVETEWGRPTWAWAKYGSLERIQGTPVIKCGRVGQRRQTVGEWRWVQGALGVCVPAAEMGVTFALDLPGSLSERIRTLVMSGSARDVSKQTG